MRLVSLPAVAFRTAFALFCANFITMLAMNAFRLSGQLQPWIYFVLFALFWWSIGRFIAPKNRLEELFSQREATLLVGAVLLMGILYAGIRFQYLLEPLMHRLALPLEDDPSHLQELNSLIHAQRYPAQSSFTLTDYFSLYYAAWMLPVALYKALPFGFVTFKVIQFLTNAIYSILFPLALSYVVIEFAQSKRQIYWALYLGGFWSGLDFLIFFRHPFIPKAFWLMDLGFHLCFANYAQSTTLTNHHLSSGIALICCAYLWNRYRGTGCVIFTSILLCYAFYSSVFVFLGGFPFIAYLWLRSFRSRATESLIVFGLSSALLFPLLWLFLRKPSAVAFEFPEQHSRTISLGSMHLHYGFVIGFLFFMVILALQYGYFTYVLAFKRKTFSTHEAVLATLALAYLISCYFIGFSHANNYCMRGLIVPVFVLSWLASSRMPAVNRKLAIVLIIAALPVIPWLANPYLRGLKDTMHPHDFLQGTSAIVKLNMDRSIREVDFSKYADLIAEKDGLRYAIEKMPMQSIQPLDIIDTELETKGPCGPWKWQRNPDIPAEPCPAK